jgi:uncharacterized membrane protein YbhN (UPF0104 family)
VSASPETRESGSPGAESLPRGGTDSPGAEGCVPSRSGGERRRALRVILPVLSAALFALAIWVLYRELRTLHLADLAGYFRQLRASRVVSAVLASGLSYLMLIGYDIVGLRYVGHPLPWGRTAFASFVAYGLSNTLGFSFVSGGVVRYRLYSALGVTGAAIARVVLFTIFSSFLGFFTVAGVCFVVRPERIPASVGLPAASIRPIGVLFLVLVVLYVFLVLLHRRPLRIGSRSLILPPPRLLPWQLLVSAFDWSFAAATLFLLSPPLQGVSLPGFVSIFMSAQFVGLVSHVPGGLGVFEAAMLLLVPAELARYPIIGALALFRVIYYLVPLAAASIMLGLSELRHLRRDGGSGGGPGPR